MEGVTDSQAFLHAKLRNAEVVEAMGMRGSLRRLWLQVHRRQLQGQADGLRVQPCACRR